MDEQKTGKSFYFFDFDDNLMFLDTPIFLTNTQTGEERSVSTSQYAALRPDLGKPGPWQDYKDTATSYQRYYDRPPSETAAGARQYFTEDIENALQKAAVQWQAPSWPLFDYACRNQRPVALITARGHSRETIMEGVKVLVDKGFLVREPDYLAIFAVNNPEMAEELLGQIPDHAEAERVRALADRTSILKRIAIGCIVDKALALYGASLPHRFGMSDDDPMNVALITKAMCDCKRKYRDKRFFVINTHEGEDVKLEVFPADYPVTGCAKPDEVIG